MSSDTTAIRAGGVGKCYQVYAAPADRLKQFVLPRLRGGLGLRPQQYFREFWALNNISFEVARGETVGIIGRNGSGKSTLLQIICGTLTPTSGTVETQGRVAALLELGAGFNPEYTGRENVYLNCAVLGLTRDEIDQRFESIVDFSEIRDFIDQPVKTYSSGMFARLAFSAAIHVEPEILVVDETLSVGDFAFQFKCIKRLKELSERGCTVLFVAHDIEQVQKLCTRALYLKGGQMEFFGDAATACDRYLADLNAADSLPVTVVATTAAAAAGPAHTELFAAFAEKVKDFRNQPAANVGEIAYVSINGKPHSETVSVAFGEEMTVEVIFRFNEEVSHPTLAFYVTDHTGQLIVGTNTRHEQVDLRRCAPGEYHRIWFRFTNRLRRGNFAIRVYLVDDPLTGVMPNYIDYIDLAADFICKVEGAERWCWFSPEFDTGMARISETHE